jgi:hypothetical protein
MWEETCDVSSHIPVMRQLESVAGRTVPPRFEILALGPVWSDLLVTQEIAPDCARKIFSNPLKIRILVLPYTSEYEFTEYVFTD